MRQPGELSEHHRVLKVVEKVQAYGNQQMVEIHGKILLKIKAYLKEW